MKKLKFPRVIILFALILVTLFSLLPMNAFAAGTTISLKDQSVTYTGEPIQLDAATVTGTSASDVVHYSYSEDITSDLSPRFTEDAYPTNVGKYFVYATVVDKNGKELANSGKYAVLSIVKRALTITADSDTKEYDGTPLMKNNYTINGTLGKGDVLSGVVVTGSQTAVGVGQNTATGATVKKEQTDVTKNYAISYVPGTLTVTLKQTTVTLKDKIAQYSVSAIAIDPATVTGSSSAPEYHYYSDKDLKNPLSGPPTDVGEYYVKATVAADAQFGAGESNVVKLIITPYSLTITANGATKTYDGNPLMIKSYSVSDLLSGHKVASVTVTGTQTQVGESNNVPSNAKIVDGSGNDVTKNYIITYVKGILNIVKATPAIIVTDKTVVYNGSGVESNAATVENVNVPWKPSEIVYTYYAGATKLPAGTLPTNAGTYRVIAQWIDPSNTHSLDTDQAIITILKRGDPGPDPQNPLPEVTVTAPSAEKKYDGTPLTSSDLKDCITVNLAPGHKLSNKTIITGTQTAVGVSPNTFKDGKIYIEDAHGNDVTKNYVITPPEGIAGTLKVTPVSPGIIEKGPDVTVTKTVDKTTAKVGDTLTYTITLTNSGDADATGFKLIDIPSEHITITGATINSAVINLTANYVVPTIAKNGGKVVIIATAKATKVGTASNTVNVTAPDDPAPIVPVDPPETEITEPKVPETDNPNTPDIPKTGDMSNSMLWLTLLFISGAGVFTLVLVEWKRKKYTR